MQLFVFLVVFCAAVIFFLLARHGWMEIRRVGIGKGDLVITVSMLGCATLTILLLICSWWIILQ